LLAADSKAGEVFQYTRYTGPVWCVAISPDGALGLCGGGDDPGGKPYLGADHTIHLINLRNGEKVRRFAGHTQNVRAVAFCPDGARFVSGSWDKTLRLWDVRTGEELGRFDGHEGPVTSLAISRDGRFMISGAEKDNTVHVWDLVQRVEVGWLRGHSDGIECVALSADGRLALSGSNDRTVRLWNVPWRQELHCFEDFANSVGGVGFINNDKDILAGTNYCDAEHVLRQWDVANAEPGSGLVGKTGGVKSLSVSADGRRALTGNQDGTVRLWDAVRGEELQRFDGHGAPAFVAVALSADGRLGLSGGSDQVVKLWRLAPAGTDP
jgi:WD40 repeat protein